MLHKINNPFDSCEFKFNDSDKWTFEGYASVFNSTDLGGDTVAPGAFDGAVKAGPDALLMRYEHLRHTTPGKYVHVEQDSKGFFVAGELTKGHTLAADIRASFKHGTIKGLSIGWLPGRSVIEKKSDGGRILKSVWTKEVSITADPMEPNAVVTDFKSDVESIKSLRDAELLLRESGGLSRQMATAFVSQIKSLCQSDSDEQLREQITELKSRLRGREAAAQLQKAFDKYSLENLIK